MKTRHRFECWTCKRAFGRVVDLEAQPVLLLECPYCGATCKVDLSPYRQRVVTVTRGQEGVPDLEEYAFPETIQTAEPAREELDQGD